MQAAPNLVAKQLDRHAIRKNSNYKALCKVSLALQEAVADMQHSCF
jgi:hypothetical protein